MRAPSVNFGLRWSGQDLKGTVRDWASRTVDACLAGVIFLAPLFMGGRGPLGKFVFIALACTAAMAWALGQCLTQRARWRWSGSEWLLIAGLVLVLVQLIPLPEWLLLRLSPGISQLLPLYTTGGDETFRISQWSTISLSPMATRGALVVYLAYVMLFLVVVQRADSVADVERLLRWIALGAVFLATLGLLQFLLSNGKFLWVYEHPSRSTDRVVMGPFQNQNHFAHCLALGIGPLVWWLWQTGFGRGGLGQRAFAGFRSSRGFSAPQRGGKLSPTALRHALFIGLGLVSVACLLTFSRGAFIAFSVAVLVCLVIYYWKALLGRRSLFVLAAMALIILSSLLLHGYEPLAGQLSTLRDARSLEELSAGRSALWSALWEGTSQFWLCGSGIGSQSEVYPIFMDEYFDVQFTHGESGYLPLLLEAGLPGLLLVLCGIGISGWWCLGSLRARDGSGVADQEPADRQAGEEAAVPKHFWAAAGAVAAGLAASAVHSVGDFVWYISACMSVTVLLLACACRLYQLAPSRHLAEPTAGSGAGAWRVLLRFVGPGQATATRLPWATTCVVTALVTTISAGMLHESLPAALASPAWNEYRCLCSANRALVNERNDAAEELLYRASQQLKIALAANPDDPQANIKMAAVCLRQFDLEQLESQNPMSLVNIRDAALASRFPSREAQDEWLSRAVGENRKLLDRALAHCRRGLRLSPLQGEGYIYLAELSFLDGPQEAAKQAYLVQAQRVRPHNGLVQFHLGKEAALAGQFDQALEYWKYAFHRDPDVQHQIIEVGGAIFPARFFLQEFAPELDGLAGLFSYFRRTGREADAVEIGAPYVTALKRAAQQTTGTDASNYWQQARSVHTYLGQPLEALSCQRMAVKLDPSNFRKRRALAQVLVESGNYDEAVAQFQWCLYRQPGDDELANQLADAKRLSIRMRSTRQPSATEPRRQQY